MRLSGKQILIFAAAGEIGSVVARELAARGGHVWISGRRREAIDALAAQIAAAGGSATADVVDATDERAVTAYVDSVARRAGRVDVVFNAIGARPAAMGFPAAAVDLSMEALLRPIGLILGSSFLTARAAGAKMIRQGSGSIITLSAVLSVMTMATMTGLTATYGAMEAMTRTLAGEFGPSGVRVNCVRSNGLPETSSIGETYAEQVRILGRPPAMGESALRRPVTIAEVASTVAFLASDDASGITGQVLTVCAGQFVG